MTKTPSRVLNEKMNFMALSLVDIAGLGYFLIITHSLLAPFKIELFSFAVTGITAMTLISIRIKQRPKIIRDFVGFAISRKILNSNGAFQ